MVTGAGMSLVAKVGVLVAVAVAVAEGENQSAEWKSDTGTLSLAKVTVLARALLGMMSAMGEGAPRLGMHCARRSMTGPTSGGTVITIAH
jgi:hypothetical protein